MKARLLICITQQPNNRLAHKEYLQRRDEPFYRITAKNLTELFEEYEENGSTYVAPGPELVAKMVKDESGEYSMQRQPENNQSGGLASGGPRVVSYEEDEDIQEDYPYLILDTRSVQEFNINRIHRGKANKTSEIEAKALTYLLCVAKSFPSAYVNRDNLLPELYQFVRSNQSHYVVLRILPRDVEKQRKHLDYTVRE